MELLVLLCYPKQQVHKQATAPSSHYGIIITSHYVSVEQKEDVCLRDQRLRDKVLPNPSPPTQDINPG